MSGRNYINNKLNNNEPHNFDLEENLDLANENGSDKGPEDDYDALNEETFATNLNDEDVGDWEAEHDQLLLMEDNGPLSKLESNRTPTKEDDSSSTSSSSTSSDDSLVKTPEAKPPTLTKILPNVKTLEEIETELLNNSANTSLSSKAESAQSKNSDILRLFPQLATIANQQDGKAATSNATNSPDKNKTNGGGGDNSFLNKSQLFAADLELSELTANSSFNTSSSQQQVRPQMPPLLPIPQHQQHQPGFLDPVNNQLSDQLKNNLFPFERNLNLPIRPPQDKMIDLMHIQPNQMNYLKNMIGLSNPSRVSNSDINNDFLRLSKIHAINSNNILNHPLSQINNQQKPPPNKVDRLSGMMTDKEKNWVVSVQMLQLQNDDPYSYDFYYTSWMLKKKNKTENAQMASLKTLLNQTANNKDPKSYRPLTFENSLGKVTMSNFHHPRALIDVNSKSPDHIQLNSSSLLSQIESIEEDGDKPKEKKNLSTILLEIEQMYQVFLNVEEIDHRILKEPGEMRAHLFQERRLKVDKLASMMCSENFAHYLFVAKGRRLLGRCIPTFNLIHTKQILAYFMQYIYLVSKNNICLDEIYSQISSAVDTQKFNDITEILIQFNQIYTKQSTQVYKTIFSNKFALTFLLKFFSKSEMIAQDDYDIDIKSIWSLYLNNVLNGLTTLPEENLRTSVYETYVLNINAIFDNFTMNFELWNKNEKKLGELFVFSE